MYKIVTLSLMTVFALPISANSSAYLSGAGTTIAVIDSGITRHSDLQLESEYCFLTQSQCDQTKHGHGTHVAGIIASNGNTSPIGLAHRTQLVSLRVTDTKNQYSHSDIVDAALQYVLENHNVFNVVNLSISSDKLFSGDDCDYATSSTRDTGAIVDQLTALNIKVVASTGNNGSNNSISYPACLRNVIAVSANQAKYSNLSSATDISANGSRVLSTWINGSVKQLDGTSMAAAATSACLAKLDEAAGKKVHTKIIKWLSEPWKNDVFQCSQLIEDYQQFDGGLTIDVEQTLSNSAQLKTEKQAAGIFTTTMVLALYLFAFVRQLSHQSTIRRIHCR